MTSASSHFPTERTSCEVVQGRVEKEREADIGTDREEDIGYMM